MKRRKRTRISSFSCNINVYLGERHLWHLKSRRRHIKYQHHASWRDNLRAEKIPWRHSQPRLPRRRRRRRRPERRLPPAAGRVVHEESRPCRVLAEFISSWQCSYIRLYHATLSRYGFADHARTVINTACYKRCRGSTVWSCAGCLRGSRLPGMRRQSKPGWV